MKGKRGCWLIGIGCISTYVLVGSLMDSYPFVSLGIFLGVVLIIIIIFKNFEQENKKQQEEKERQAEVVKQRLEEELKAKFVRERQAGLERERQAKIEKEKFEKLEQEKKRLEALQYENVTVVFTYIDEDGTLNAILRRSDNTFIFVKRGGKPPYSSYTNGTTLKLLRETTNTWNWVNEQEYLRQRKIKEQRAYQLQQQRELEKQKALYATYKTNWLDFKNALQKRGITQLYHFTDKINLLSIKTNGGLYSWDYCQRNDIPIPRPGGSKLSWFLDQQKGLENYVRLSFVREHPMMYVAKRDGRIVDPVILEISTDVIFKKETMFAEQNAARNNITADGTFEKFNEIKFSILSNKYFDLEEEEKPYYQAEVLVLEKVPLNYILNINKF